MVRMDFTQSLCLTNTGVNTSKLNRLGKFYPWIWNRRKRNVRRRTAFSSRWYRKNPRAVLPDSPWICCRSCMLRIYISPWRRLGGNVLCLCRRRVLVISSAANWQSIILHFFFLLYHPYRLHVWYMPVSWKSEKCCGAFPFSMRRGISVRCIFIIPGFSVHYQWNRPCKAWHAFWNGTSDVCADHHSGCNDGSVDHWLCFSIWNRLTLLKCPLPVEMWILLRLIASFCGVFGFSVMFNSPIRLAATAALIGAVANTLRLELVDLAGMPPAVTAFYRRIDCRTSCIADQKTKQDIRESPWRFRLSWLWFRDFICTVEFITWVWCLFLFAASWFAAAILIIAALPLGLIFCKDTDRQNVSLLYLIRAGVIWAELVTFGAECPMDES